MSFPPSTRFPGEDIASVLNCITTTSSLPSHPPPYTDINTTSAFLSVCEWGKPSSKINKQVTIVGLTLQDNQQRCCVLIINSRHLFLNKYTHIEVHSPIGTEGARGYSTTMYYTVGVFQQTCTYYDILIYILWIDYRGIYQLVLKMAFIHTYERMGVRTDDRPTKTIIFDKSYVSTS